MKIAAKYSFNGGLEVVQSRYPTLLKEIESAIYSIDSSNHKTKISKEKTMVGKSLFSPIAINKAFKDYLNPLGWSAHKEFCDYPTEFYTEEYSQEVEIRGAFREMDFVKQKLGVEVQFGKYSFMVYNVAAKMTIFKNLGVIDTGIEIVPVKAMSNQMSSGVSYFEQFVWDLEKRGEADIDIPVLIIGIMP